MERDSFIFYRSFLECLKDLEPQDAKNLMIAIGEYALDGGEIETEGIVKTIFNLIRPQLDANNRRYQNGCRGGKPKDTWDNSSKPKANQNLTKHKPKVNQTGTKPEPNDNDNVNDNDNENDNVNVNDKKKEKIIKKKFLDFVQLSDDEYQKLVERFGTKKANELIEKLNNYIGSTGKRYKSHYFTILNWSKNDPGGNKDYEREKQKELHNQKILKQFLDSTINGNESNSNQKGGYNRRNDIGFKEVSG